MGLALFEPTALTDPVLHIHASPCDIDAAAWNALLAQQAAPSPFMRHEYLAALHESGSATPDTGWTPRIMTLQRGDALLAACPLYLKDHSYGEYVFDWAWANAYQEHGLAYYPKAVVAVPFTPVPGSRLLARDGESRALLVQALIAWCRQENLSSLHLLFGADEDILACAEAGLMVRDTIQFHWKNVGPAPATVWSVQLTGEAHCALTRPDGGALTPATTGAATGTQGWRDFDDFLASLSHDKRKKIRQERRKVQDAGVTFRWSRGVDISATDWDFFYRCYARTYREHGNAPYLSRAFFQGMADTLPEAWLLFVAERAGTPIATSLIALYAGGTGVTATFGLNHSPQIAYGRYWGALERVDCLHFEACYYQPLAWCIAHGVQRFEGGAQGEHKMARALMPVKTHSAHWLAHPTFADAVERFLAREGQGIENYMEHLEQRSPFRGPGAD